MALFYLQYVNGTIVGKTLLLVAGLFCFPRIFGRCSSFGNCKIRPMEQTQMQAGNTKRLASLSPEKDNKKAKDALCKTCSKPAMEDILECIIMV